MESAREGPGMKQWVSPTLTIHGTVAEITHGTWTSDKDFGFEDAIVFTNAAGNTISVPNSGQHS